MKENDSRVRQLKTAERLAIIERLKANYNAIVDSYEYPLGDQISVLEESKYFQRHQVEVDEEDRITTFSSLAQRKHWEGLCGVEGVNVVDAATLKAIRFDLKLMN